MSYADLREFIILLEQKNALKRIKQPISPFLEVTEICSRTLHQQGPALLFENTGTNYSLLANLFGTEKRIALAMGVETTQQLTEIGELLAYLKQPDPPKGFKDLLQKIPLMKQVLTMNPKTVSKGVCQENVLMGADIDLSKLPIQTCWPDDAGPLITWPLVVTRHPVTERLNLGIYRQQVIAKNKVIMRWLVHRGGALDFQAWQAKYPNEPFPVSVVIGADPATTLAAVTPIPDNLSEYAFAGLLRKKRTEVVACQSNSLVVPSTAEFIFEGFIYPNETADEGPFGDHTGYYNEIEKFPVFTIERITHRDNPIYLSTYTGKPPDEPSVLGLALNEVFIPILKRQFPEILDFYLPAEGCSYRLGIIRMKKQYAGHAKRVMFGIWSFLKQFMYTKFLIVVDEDIDIRDWKEVVWAMTTRMDPERDSVIINNTPIDYLDFASPISGLGSKIGFDATNKWPGETSREWGRPIHMNEAIKQKIDKLWTELGI